MTNNPILANPRFARAYARDATKAIAALNEARSVNDIAKLTSTFHSMKSALANIGESEKSAFAFELERAGSNGDMEHILLRIDEFIATLQGLIPDNIEFDLDSTLDISNLNKSNTEDTAFVKEQLAIIKTACDDYDIGVIDIAFKALDEKKLNPKTHTFIERIRDLLYSDSEFDGVSQRVAKFLSEY